MNCGQRKSYSAMQAGHFLPAGRYSAVRYTELNINGECAGCNSFDKRKLSYEANLKKRYGFEPVEGLKIHAELTPVHQWKAFEIEELLETYKQKFSKLQDTP